MVTRAYQLWSSYRWAGPLFMYSGRDQGTDPSSTDDWFGMLNFNYTAKPAFDAYSAVSQAMAAAARHAQRSG